MHRRALLASLGAGTLPFAGCIAGPHTGGTDGTGTTAGGDGGIPLPDGCPTTRGIDVEWPEELDEGAAVSFVEAYEQAYYRDEVVEYEPESRLDSYELSGGVQETPQSAGEGWILEYSGSGGVYRPTLALGATTADPPAGADVVSVSEFEDDELTEMLREAAETGEAEHHVDPPGEPVERYLDRFESRSDDFDGPAGRGDSDTLYVDVEGEPVELTVAATDFHGDYWWSAWYYVDEQVVRRTDDEDADPRGGELLECREFE